MRLQLVPAHTGVVWVKLGIQAFVRQPLALAGLFFLFMALISIASLLPWLGNVLALCLLPGVTLGFMAATRETLGGRFPMPLILLSAFRAGRERLRAMLVLGVLYACGFLLLMGASALCDGGQFARMYLLGVPVSREVLQTLDFQAALLVAMALYLPLSLMFWHAPALVHWHGVGPVKALFFSAVACLRNFAAFTLYGLTWLVVFVAAGVLVSLIGQISGSESLLASAMLPLALLLAAMFFTSIYFSFRDSFVQDSVQDVEH